LLIDRVLLTNIGTPVANATHSTLALDLCVGEQGELHYAYARSGTGGVNTDMDHYVLNTRIAPEGTLNPRTQVLTYAIHADTADASASDEGVIIRPGPRGGVWVTYLHNESIEEAQHPTYSSEIAVEPHPRDIYLATMNVPATAAGANIESDGAFGIFATRPKKMNHPILVGNRGDYQGYVSFRHALEAGKRYGDDLVLRRGRVPGALTRKQLGISAERRLGDPGSFEADRRHE